MADGRGVGLPLARRQLSNLHGEVADGGGPIAAWDPLEAEASGGHFCLGHQELPGRRRPLCNQRMTDQGHVRGCSPGKGPPGTAVGTADTHGCAVWTRRWEGDPGSHGGVMLSGNHVGRCAPAQTRLEI